MTIQPRNTPAPAPVAPLPPRDPGCRGPISRPSRSVPFSIPIDNSLGARKGAQPNTDRHRSTVEESKA